MKHLELHRFKKAIGKATFGLFFPNENKRLNQKHGIGGKQPDLMLVSVGTGKQTAAAGYLRDITGWTVKKSTAFVKEGDYPKVVIYNLKAEEAVRPGYSIKEIIEIASTNHVIFEIY